MKLNRCLFMDHSPCGSLYSTPVHKYFYKFLSHSDFLSSYDESLGTRLINQDQLRSCYPIFFFPDNDECAAVENPCSPVATCNNTVGSFLCECNAGYSGDGFICTG